MHRMYHMFNTHSKNNYYTILPLRKLYLSQLVDCEKTDDLLKWVMIRMALVPAIKCNSLRFI